MQIRVHAAISSTQTIVANAIYNDDPSNDVTDCGAREFALDSTYGFINIESATGVVTLISSDEADADTHTVTVTAKLTNYPDVPQISESFEVTIEDYLGARDYTEDICAPGYDQLLAQ